jgi:hypothetical protein
VLAKSRDGGGHEYFGSSVQTSNKTASEFKPTIAEANEQTKKM